MRCAVLGSPIAHSLSPVLHRAAYAELGLTGWTYDAVQVDEAGLPAFVEGLDATWRGLSLTMPLKRTVLPLLDTVTPVAAAAGAVNTVLLGDGRVGDNTDVPGAAAAIRERTDAAIRHAVVLGGGATAGSLVLALAGLGCEQVTLLVRDPARAAEALAVGERHGGVRVTTAPLDGDPVSADLVASTIPASAQSPEVVARFAEVPVVFEVVYDPWPTPLAAAAAGRTLVSGLDLLVHQAALQIALMTRVPVVDVQRLVPAIRASASSALS